jgi:hypothetical protein
LIPESETMASLKSDGKERPRSSYFGGPRTDNRYRPHGDKSKPWKGQAWGLASSQVHITFEKTVL